MIKVCSLFSGSSGNCIFVSSNNTKILIDAGKSGKKIEKAISDIDEQPEKINAILVTHEHSDHIQGVGILSRRYNIPIYANKKTWDSMRKQLGKLSNENIKVFTSEEKFFIDQIEVLPFKIPHDASEPVAFSMFVEGKKVTTATDIGHMNSMLLKNLENSDMILLESNHDIEMLKMGRYPWHLKQRILSDNGHLCNEMAGKVVSYLAQNGTKYFLLGHLSEENNFPELAYQTVCNALNEKCIIPGEDVFLEVASRNTVSKVVEIV